MKNQKQLFILQFIVLVLIMNPILIEAASRLQINTSNKESVIANENASINNAKDSTVSLIGEWTGGDSYAVYITDDIAYFSKEDYTEASPHYMEIVDISDPINPRELGSIKLPTTSIIKDIVVYKGYAYIAADSAGLRIINISDPTNTYESGFYDTNGSLSGIAIDGNFAYVADGTAGLRIINISDASNPTEIGFVETEGSANGIAKSGDHVYVADNSGLVVLNVSDPANPREIGLLKSYGTSIVVKEPYAYMAAGSGFYIIDISNPANPKEIVYHDTHNGHHFVKNLKVEGDYVYLAHGYSGLCIVDISSPTYPKTKGYFDKNSSYYNDIDVIGNFAFVALYESSTSGNNRSFGGMEIIDITDTSNPSLSGVFKTNVDFKEVAINKNYAFVADYRSGLRILNITNSNKVVQTGIYVIPGIDKVVIAGNYAYVLDHSFHIIDISDPSKPTLSGTFEHNDIANDVAINGEYAYIVYSRTGEIRQGLKILDISNPVNPVQIGSLDISDQYEIVFKENYAYVLNNTRLKIINVVNPSNPHQIGQFDVEGKRAVGFTIYGDFAYVANWSDGLRIIDITDPLNVFEAGFYNIGTNAESVSVSGEFVYVASGYDGLQVIDMANPEDPIKIGFLDVDGDNYIYYANDVASDAEYAYVAYGKYGLCVIGKNHPVGIEDISDPTSQNFILEQNFPNPFNTVTTINYSLQIDSKCKITVFDIMGREIKILVDKKQTAGTYSVLFDSTGLDNGIYTYTLQVDSYAQRRKMLILR